MNHKNIFALHTLSSGCDLKNVWKVTFIPLPFLYTPSTSMSFIPRKYSSSLAFTCLSGEKLPVNVSSKIINPPYQF